MFLAQFWRTTGDAARLDRFPEGLARLINEETGGIPLVSAGSFN
jgi:hypothetical protein